MPILVRSKGQIIERRETFNTDTLYLTTKNYKILGEIRGFTDIGRPKTKAENRRGDTRYNGGYRQEFNKMHVWTDISGERHLTVKGGQHNVTFNVTQPYERNKLLTSLAKAMGGHIYKAKGGGFNIYLSRTK